MSVKRNLQYLKRGLTGLLKNGSLKSKAIVNMEESIESRVPKFFDKAIFNFSIDFELAWAMEIWGDAIILTKEELKRPKSKKKTSILLQTS